MKKYFVFTTFSFYQGSYMTIHVTPEPQFSYVSFETNVPLSSYEELIRRIAETFQPGKFIVTLMANKVCYSILEIRYYFIQISGSQVPVGRDEQ